MPLDLKLRKSAGIKVTARVSGLIRQGNAARARSDWDAAAAAYRAALVADPSLPHIQIQLGHSLKEGGRPDDAVGAYKAALALRPNDPEPLVLIGHLRKTQGDRRGAAAHFIQAIRTLNDDGQSLDELHALLSQLRPIDRTILHQASLHAALSPAIPPEVDPATAAAAIAHVLETPNAIKPQDDEILRSAHALLASIGRTQPASATADRAIIVFDVTDLIAHFRHHRLPTGIQRVQIEVVTRALRDPAIDVSVCCFIDGRETLIGIPGPLFMELAVLATANRSSDAAEWKIMIGRLAIHLFVADPFAFRHGDRLVNLGTSWWVYDYFLLVRNAKRDHAITYIPFIHDLIPIMAADHCVSGVIGDYVSWLLGVFDHADAFLVNSRSTRDDLMRVAQRLGHGVDAAAVEIVPLDADFRQLMENELPADALGRWRLAGEEYCLFVSTIESRKNHVLALEAWIRLIDTHGAEAVPMLVCVGRSGWLNATFFNRLRNDSRLRQRVLVIERVSDSELALLYRHCSFTLYPSHYEGWGLPVTESLCYGKVPVVADNSSLTEAGGDFALYFESNSITGLVGALERILFEPGCRERLEQAIAARFMPRSWASIATQVTDAVIARDRNAATLQAPMAQIGRYYPTALYKEPRIWRGLGSGEIFRSGSGWLWPEPQGCRTTLAGGTLLFRTETQGPFRLYLRLRGLAAIDSAFTVSVGDRGIVSGNLAAGEERWVLGDLPPGDGMEPLSFRVRGKSTEDVDVVNGGTPKRLSASITVVGFALVELDDDAGRLRFVEHAGLGGLDQINAYAEPMRGQREIWAA